MSQQVLFDSLASGTGTGDVLMVNSATANTISVGYGSPITTGAAYMVKPSAFTHLPGVVGTSPESLSMTLTTGSLKTLLTTGTSVSDYLYFRVPFTVSMSVWDTADQPVRVTIGTNIGLASSPTEGNGYVTINPANTVSDTALGSNAPLIAVQVSKLANAGVTALKFSIALGSDQHYSTTQFIDDYVSSFIVNTTTTLSN